MFVDIVITFVDNDFVDNDVAHSIGFSNCAK